MLRTTVGIVHVAVRILLAIASKGFLPFVGFFKSRAVAFLGHRSVSIFTGTRFAAVGREQ
jgi:hypothetical protein